MQSRPFCTYSPVAISLDGYEVEILLPSESVT